MTLAHTPDTAQQALERVQHAWSQAAASWDVDALAALYTEDALFMGGRPGHQIGRTAIRDYFASYTGTILSASLTLSDFSAQQIDPGCVMGQGFVNFKFHLKGDEHTTSRLRGAWVLQAHAEGWRIRLHHFSTEPVQPPLGSSR
ncbi:hypothetical protein B9Z47_00320 [Limnohabitans sp. 2KL-1]|uniref:YybH family protein n=1 Tax=Limnohabitans sp. 2KL-1 TaxID=1100699 RepID=UPI000D374EEF|nr:SgcJ/EcaC family oxidoreductase [Limnohabitans sp. 2KL-1]PUE50255.1 hypothetical protein B9Z47_00320 [Limnohabitans sp. 2KL-1]